MPKTSFSYRGIEEQIAELQRQVQQLQQDVDPATVTNAQLRVGTAMARGAYAGYGNPQNSEWQVDKNCDATHGATIYYVVPGNFQRLIQARLSMALLPYETYDATAAAAPHVHYWVAPAKTDVPVYYVTAETAGTASKFGSRQAGGGGTPAPIGWQTSSEKAAAVQASAGATVEAYDVTGHVHSQVLGVSTGATATSVTLTIDGDSYTTALGGPFTTDQIELNLTPSITTAGKTYLKQGVLHKILLTPSGLGRITAFMRLTYFADGSVPA